jgi:hypothetical protein
LTTNQEKRGFIGKPSNKNFFIQYRHTLTPKQRKSITFVSTRRGIEKRNESDSRQDRERRDEKKEKEIKKKYV